MFQTGMSQQKPFNNNRHFNTKHQDAFHSNIYKRDSAPLHSSCTVRHIPLMFYYNFNLSQYHKLSLIIVCRFQQRQKTELLIVVALTIQSIFTSFVSEMWVWPSFIFTLSLRLNWLCTYFCYLWYLCKKN